VWLGSGESLVLGPPSDDHVTAVLHRVLRRLQREWADEGVSWADDEYEAMQQQAIQQRLALPETGSQRRRRVSVAHGLHRHRGARQ
jgi:hypothetical protein